MAIKRPIFFIDSGGFEEADENDTLPANPVIRPYFDDQTENSTVGAFPVLAVTTAISLQQEKYQIQVSAEITGTSAGQGKQTGFKFDVGGVEYVTDVKDVVTADAYMLISTAFIFDNTGAVSPGNVNFDFYFGVVAGNFTAKIRRKRIIAIKAVEGAI